MKQINHILKHIFFPTLAGFNLIPKDKNERVLEIINYVGKQLKIKLIDYGFHEINDNSGVIFGWVCWVKYWRFVDNKSKEIELIEYRKKGNNK